MSDMKKIIVALDDMDRGQLDLFLKRIYGKISTVKIGMELYYRYGKNLIRHIHQNYKMDIFLDLKLHDIPHTVKKSLATLKDLPLKFTTIHLSGGDAMLEEAVSQIKISLPSTKLLGVGILTSLDRKDLHDLWGVNDMEEYFSKLVLLNIKKQIPGMILSARELFLVKKIEKEMGVSLVKVCPGIRFSQEKQDQKRVATPQDALKAGADYLIMGRALTKADNLEEKLEILSSLCPSVY